MFGLHYVNREDAMNTSSDNQALPNILDVAIKSPSNSESENVNRNKKYTMRP